MAEVPGVVNNSWLNRVPGVVGLRKQLRLLAIRRRNSRVLRQLGRTPYAQGTQIQQALIALGQEHQPADKKWFTRIEAEREQLLARDEPLVDGSLGKGGLYDVDVTIGNACGVSKRPRPARLLYLLTKALDARNVIELGTNVGISSAYIAAAQQVRGQGGQVTTLDASSYRQRLARTIHENLALDNIGYVEGLFTDTLTPTLEKIGTVDLAFIDGHHQYQPTLDYFNILFNFSTPETVFVFDDIRWSDGMAKAWAEMQADTRLGFIADVTSVGVCVRHREKFGHRWVFDRMQLF